jgi:hypothetical protein
MKKLTVSKEKRRGSGLKRRLASFLIIAASVLFLVFTPSYFTNLLGRDEYSEWMKTAKEPPVDVIKLWHVGGVRPYSGSLGNWLKQNAERYSKRFTGVYFEVKTYSEEAAIEQLARGNYPDIISFSSENQLDIALLDLSADGVFELIAIPYCFSKRVVVSADGSNLPTDQNGSPELFKRGKCDSCVCDVRSAADLYRAQTMGKCRSFEVTPSNEEPILQYLAVREGVDEAKLTYAKGFISFVLSRKRQDTLCSFGLFPTDPEAKKEFDPEWLKTLFESIDAPSLRAFF